VHLNGSLRESLVTTQIDNPVALAYDWIHYNLYWADVGLHPGRARIEVLTLHNRWHRILLDESAVRSPVVMVVDPRREQGYCSLCVIYSYLLYCDLIFLTDLVLAAISFILFHKCCHSCRFPFLLTAVSSASWSNCNPPSNFVNVSTVWFIFCCWPQSQDADLPRPYLCRFAWHALNCLETVKHRLYVIREIETRLPDSRVSYNSVDHRSRWPVLPLLLQRLITERCRL